MKIKFYRTTDAFLYLPIYLVDELGILEELLPDCQIEFPKIQKESDIVAIKNMLLSNCSEKNSISIAIADPTAFLSKKWQTEVEEKNRDLKDDCKVIGTLIHKLPFWAVNHKSEIFYDENCLRKNYDSIIYYENNFVTGNYLGNDIYKSYNFKHHQKITEFGKEIDAVINANNDNEIKTFTISADIVSIAKNLQEIDSTKCLSINYDFSSSPLRKEFLTTGILTSGRVIKEHRNKLSKIIEAIQKSILILYSSKKVAKYVANIINKKSDYKLNEKQINFIVDKILQEKFYPYDLNISKESWEKIINARAKVEQWEKFEKDKILKESFSLKIDNSVVQKAELDISIQLGITIDNFVFNTNTFMLFYKKRMAHHLSKGKKWVLMNFILMIRYFLIFTIIFILINSFYKFCSWCYVDWKTAVFPLLFYLLTFLNKEKNANHK